MAGWDLYLMLIQISLMIYWCIIGGIIGEQSEVLLLLGLNSYQHKPLIAHLPTNTHFLSSSSLYALTFVVAQISRSRAIVHKHGGIIGRGITQHLFCPVKYEKVLFNLLSMHLPYRH